MAGPDPDLEQFAKELIKDIRKVPGQTVKVVRRGSQNVKRDARRSVRLTAPTHHARAYVAINYDVTAEGVEVVGEVGYDKEVQASEGKKGPGALGNLLEFGGGGDHSPPHLDLALALAIEAPHFEEALADMGEDILAGRLDTVARKRDAVEPPE